MSKRSLLLTGLVVLATLPPIVGSTPAVEELLKASDHEALGKQIALYMTARQNTKGIDKAQGDIAENLDKIKKRLKGRDPLSLTADLGKSFWLSFSYDVQKNAKKGKVSTVSVAVPFYGEKEQIEYAIYAPPKYDPKKAYPLLLCIPEKGAKVAEHIAEKWTSEAIRENAIIAAVPMPEDEKQWAGTGSPGKPGGAGNLLTVMREATRTYAVDFDRIYLVGRGEGVGAALTIGSRYPDRFAGVIGRSGDPTEVPPENFKNLPTFFAGAGGGATSLSEKLEKAGYNNCTIKPEAQEADIWAWIQDHPRASNPAEVVLLPGSPAPSKAYWLEVPTFDGEGKALLKATIDRATNTIVVDGEGVTSVTLYFNDLLIDMDKQIKVVCNGTEHLDLIPRNLPAMLDWMFYARSDPGRLYTAKKLYELPAKAKPK